jgi:DNA-binding protein H-NS
MRAKLFVKYQTLKVKIFILMSEELIFIKGNVMDLSDLSVKDLRALEDQVKQEIKKREHEDVVKAREQILAIAQSVGIPLKELIGSNVRIKPTAAVAVRYRHPSDASLQWTGRGRQPKWVKDWVESGQALSALRV